MDDLTSKGHDLLSSRIILSGDDAKRECERVWDLESMFYKDVEKLGLFRRDIKRIDIEIPFRDGNGVAKDGVTEVTSPEIKWSLDADEDIGVDEVSSMIDGVSDSEEVVVSGGEALGVDEDEPNRVISVLKDGGDEFGDNIDEINLGLREEYVIRVLEDRDVSGEKSREVFSITPWATKGGKRVLCYVQGNRRRKKKKSIGCSSGRQHCALLGASVPEEQPTQEVQVQARMARGLCHVNLSLK
nr:hypothetical protein [Tanacetum cinerariifolium]